MVEVMQFYISSFWIWCGLTFGTAIILAAVAHIIVAFRL